MDMPVEDEQAARRLHGRPERCQLAGFADGGIHRDGRQRPYVCRPFGLGLVGVKLGRDPAPEPGRSLNPSERSTSIPASAWRGRWLGLPVVPRAANRHGRDLLKAFAFRPHLLGRPRARNREVDADLRAAPGEPPDGLADAGVRCRTPRPGDRRRRTRRGRRRRTSVAWSRPRSGPNPRGASASRARGLRRDGGSVTPEPHPALATAEEVSERVVDVVGQDHGGPALRLAAKQLAEEVAHRWTSGSPSKPLRASQPSAKIGQPTRPRGRRVPRAPSGTRMSRTGGRSPRARSVAAQGRGLGRDPVALVSCFGRRSATSSASFAGRSRRRSSSATRTAPAPSRTRRPVRAGFDGPSGCPRVNGGERQAKHAQALFGVDHGRLGADGPRERLQLRSQRLAGSRSGRRSQ